MADRTTVTERGQTSVPSRLRREHKVEAGTELVWESAGPDAWKVHIQRKACKPNPLAMLGYARKSRPGRSTASWMRKLRAGEK